MEKLEKRCNSLVQVLATMQESLDDIQKPEHKAVYKALLLAPFLSHKSE